MGKTLRLITISTWEEYLSEFITSKRIQGLRERTIIDYQKNIHRFFKLFPDCLEDYHQLYHCVSMYFAVSNIAPATFNIWRAYLKSFLSYLVREGVIPKNPIDFPKRKDEMKARNVSEEILTELLTLPDRKTFSGLRDYCLILFTLDTGTRPGEALALLPKDINLLSLEVTIRGKIAKTKVTRTLPISSLTATYLQKLLRARLTTWNDTIPVFPSCEGKPMLGTSWAHRLKGYSKRLGHSITPYSLRHSFALLYLRNGGN
ncbi:MAG: tyrosine-type recombinase/integrase, partial [Candidatus Atribacteria bacterium]|nr:tyrosine-type recombinase/integrase [Candidatus Atribacteria bacterium]